MYNLQEYRTKMEIARLKQKLNIAQQGLDILRDQTMEYINIYESETVESREQIEDGFSNLEDFIREC